MKKKMNNKKLLSLLILLLSILILMIMLLPSVLSKYESKVDGNIKIDAALYVLEAGYQYQNVQLNKLEPSDSEYTYNFTISNTDGTNRLETKLKYNLTIRTTTNLPLTYELYYSDDLTTSIITSNEIEQDIDGTYFRIIKTDTKYFSFEEDQTYSYTLKLKFPKEYNEDKYQDILESIEITIDSNQVLDNEEFNI